MNLSRKYAFALGLLLVLYPAGPVLADESTLAGRPRIEIVRVAQPPLLDGKLDDGAWQQAARLQAFVQQKPRDGEPATEQTEVWLAYDSRHLYLAVYAHYADPAAIRANRTDRDKIFRDDRVEFFFDTFLDQQRAYRFGVNGYGVQSDGIRNAGGRGGPGGGGPGGGMGGDDNSWDALFESRGGLVEDGWIVELAIPFKSLRYPGPSEGAEHRWGFQVVRTIENKDEDAVWSPISRDIAGFLSQMGVLYGMRELSTAKNLEILPTLTALQQGSLDRDTGSFRQHKVEPDFGVNFKYGASSNLTLDFTFNPDFSQIEADRPQITVNQRFPLFYEEKRPFFLEGKEIFNTAINLVHTRTIVDPRYGGKLTGKLGNASIGLLVANDEAPGLRDDRSDPAFGRTAHFVIGRVRYDLYSESHLGAIVTDREFLNAFNRVAGVDGRFKLGTTHRLSFMTAVSDHRGESDEGGSGSALVVHFNRESRRLDYGFNHTSFSPDFQSGTGFIRRTDMRETEASASYTFWPQRALISWGPRTSYSRNYDYQGVLQDADVDFGLNLQFARNIRLNVNTRKAMERFRDIEFQKRTLSAGGEVNFSRRFSINFHLNVGDGIRYSDTPFLGRTRGGMINVGLRPGSRLELNLSVNLSRMADRHTGAEIFDIKLYRSRTAYQFTDRLLLRSILEYDTYARKFGANWLLTYRINAGTVAFLGYDDRLEALDTAEDLVDARRTFHRTNRAFFLKLSYLFRC